MNFKSISRNQSNLKAEPTFLSIKNVISGSYPDAFVAFGEKINISRQGLNFQKRLKLIIDFRSFSSIEKRGLIFGLLL